MTGRPHESYGPDKPYAVSVPKGYRVGRWEVREPLASGAFATVYAARNTLPGAGLPSTAALKFLPTGTRTPRQLHHLRELAEREVELLQRLRAPRLIRMHETLTVEDPDHPELDGATVLVLERAEGSLDAVLDQDPAPGSGPALLAQVCEGLRQLHHAGWVHGDLKPGNVLLMKDGSARLADFNTAAELEGTHAYSPAFATPDYTPPELLWPEVSERGTRIRPTADVWAYGVLAHVVLTGTYPLPGATTEARSDAAMRYARGTEELRLSPRLPDAWRQIVTDCLSRTHQDRLAHDTATLLRRVEEAAGVTRSARLPRLRPRRWRRPALVAAVAAALLAAAGTVTYATLRDEGPSYGYHRCPYPSVCFFSEQNGNGKMCAWEESDPDWLSGRETCMWTADRPVRSIYYNGDESTGLGGVAYYRGRDYTPVGLDITRPNTRMRTGCTSQHAQGNLAGTYAPLSHQLIAHCGDGATN
ncbi:serine/threonine-protein kinase [Streptomyces sp. NBC_01235]|uniref:serine/threonine-protein kinase n=1 Tax=Streptomyces sp. NBC_01235 TaxID=2903788 RepID=UPI002E0F22BA|nr:serine/threonine-protein kinase [Streptomyces sp. NBC_01235]